MDSVTPPPRRARWRAEWVLPIDGPPIPDGAVAVDEGSIVGIGTRASVAASHAQLAEVDLGHAILAPGLVDAHCHLEWSLLWGLLPPAHFHQWLAGMIELRDSAQAHDSAIAARVGALRCLRSGTTTVADSGPAGAGIAALESIGLRGVVSLEVVGRERGPDAMRRAGEIAESVRELRRAAGPNVRVGVGPHAPYSVGPELWAALLAHPELAQGPWACHLAESPSEVEVIATGGGPLALLFASLGVVPGRWPGEARDSVVVRAALAGALASGMVAAHCVQLSPGDAALLADHDVRVATCPTSNAHLRCGVAPLGAMRAAGLRPGIGTDSPASAGPYDVRAEARTLGTVHALAGEPLPAHELVRMASADGAAALGLDEVGTLTPGKRADLVAVDPPAEARGRDPFAAFLHPEGRVVAVAVDGRALVWQERVLASDVASIETAGAEARRALC